MSERNILSDGLARDFFRKYTDLIEYKFKQEKTFKKRLDKRSTLKKYCQFNQNIFKDISLIYELNESPRNPSINMYYFESVLTKKQFLGWEENGLALHQIYMPIIQRKYNSFLSLRRAVSCEVGLHCLSRIIFRGHLKQKILEEDYNQIFEHFVLLPVIITFFNWFFQNEDIESFFFDIDENQKFLDLPIPTYDGLLLARIFFKINEPIVSVRTFVDDVDLTDEQRNIKNIMQSIFEKSCSLISNPFINSSINPESRDEKIYIDETFRFYYLKEIKKFKNDLFEFMAGNNSNLYFRLLKWFDNHYYLDELIEKYDISDYESFDIDEIFVYFKRTLGI